jgi:tetratricopeptide (TPR) repeat protein
MGLARLATQLINEQKWEAAKEPLEKMRQLYPADEGATNPYAMLAQIYRELGDARQERAALEKLSELTDDDVETFARLIELTTSAEDWAATRKYALRWLAVNPLQPGPHRAAAVAAEHLSDDALTIESYRALLLLSPFDPAEVHLKLATVLQRTKDLSAAKRHALLALEETPRYRAAHQRLLEITRQVEQNNTEKDAAAQPNPPLSNPPKK